MKYLNLQTQATRYNNIGIIYDPMCLYAVELIKEYYSSNEYDNTIFLLTPCNGFDYTISKPITRDLLNSVFYNLDIKRIIFLNFDHLHVDYYVNALNKFFQDIQIDEIWEWQYENVINEKYLYKDKVVFKPMRYVSFYEKFKIKEHKQQEYVFHFFGNIASQRRINLLQEIAINYSNYKIISGESIYCRVNELSTSGFSLNIHGNEKNLREQLRISENICLGIPVITEEDAHAYYDNIVEEYNYQNALNDVDSFLQRMIDSYDLYRAMDISELYKKMTHTDQAYEMYKNKIISTY